MQTESANSTQAGRTSEGMALWVLLEQMWILLPCTLEACVGYP